MASADTRTAVEVETRIAASPETVFDFFTDPDKMVQWMGRSAELEPRPGGAFRCDINGRNVASGEYVSLEVAEKHRQGWEHYTERLATAAAGDDPGADPWATPESD